MTVKSSKFARILQTKSAKILASFLIVVVLISSLTISSFAVDEEIPSQLWSPITLSFSNFVGNANAIAFPGPRYLTVYTVKSGVADLKVDTITSDLITGTRIYRTVYEGLDRSAIQISIECNYSSINVNGSTYTGYNSINNADFNAAQLEVKSFAASGISSAYSGSSTYYYYFNIILQPASYTEIYNAGFNAGVSSGYKEGYSDGREAALDSSTVQNRVNQARQEGYNEGYVAGRDSTDSENLGENLLGDTLSAPMNALNQFTLYQSSSGFNVTLGLVVGGAICLTLFIAFLKIFAGG